MSGSGKYSSTQCSINHIENLKKNIKGEEFIQYGCAPAYMVYDLRNIFLKNSLGNFKMINRTYKKLIRLTVTDLKFRLTTIFSQDI